MTLKIDNRFAEKATKNGRYLSCDKINVRRLGTRI